MRRLLRKLLVYILNDGSQANTDPAALDQLTRSLKK